MLLSILEVQWQAVTVERVKSEALKTAVKPSTYNFLHCRKW